MSTLFRPPCGASGNKVGASPAKVVSPCTRLSPGSTSPTSSHHRTAHRARHAKVNAFLKPDNPFVNINVNLPGSTRSKDAISSRLSELRKRADEDDRAFLRELGEAAAGSDEGEERRSSEEGAGPRSRMPMGPRAAEDGLDEGFDQVAALAGVVAADAGVVTPRSLRYLVSDPKPEIKLLHRFKPGQAGPDQAFWGSFVDKCRLAWGVFFPPPPRPTSLRPRGVAAWASGVGRMLLGGGVAAAPSTTALASARSAKQVVMNRLQMVLIADRCGVAPEQLLEMKAQTLSALAEYMGGAGSGGLDGDMQQLEVQVSALKPSGERVTMTIGFADMLADEQMRDPLAYHYENEDDDDYFLPEEDDDRVADIAEAPAAGMKAVRVAAQTVARGGGDKQAERT